MTVGFLSNLWIYPLAIAYEIKIFREIIKVYTKKTIVKVDDICKP